MKTISFQFRLVASIVMMGLFVLACSSSKNGLTEVKTPFKGSSYESNRRYFRSVASGESIQMETAKSKAILTANQRLAASVETEIKNVSEQYTNEREVGTQVGDFGQRYQQLTREVMSTTLLGSVQKDEKIYQQSNKNYLVWVAMELRKREMYQQLKKRAKEAYTLSDKEKEALEKIIDKKLEEAEAD